MSQMLQEASGNEGQRLNFGRFNDISEWFRLKDATEHHHNAIIWKHQQIKEDQKSHVS